MIIRLVSRDRIFLFLLFFIAFSGCSITPGKRPEIKGGYLNLENWDFSTRGNMILGGEWSFYWNRFLIHEGLYRPGKSDGLVMVPGSWLKAETEKSISPEGYATFGLKLRFPREKQTLKIHVPLIHFAHELYLVSPGAPPRLLTRAGEIGKSREEHSPWFIPLSAELEAAGECELIFLISGFDSVLNPGVYAPPVLGKPHMVDRSLMIERQYEQTIQGGLLVISLFMIILCFFRRENNAPFWLGLFALLMNLRSIAVNGQFQALFVFDHPFVFSMKLSYFAPALGVAAAVIYHRIIYGDIFHPLIARVSYVLSVLFTLITLFSSPLVFTGVYRVYGVCLLAQLLWFFFCYIKILTVRRNMITVAAFIAAAVTILSGIMDLFVVLAYIPGIRYFDLGMLAFILCNTIIVITHVESNRREAEEEARELEEEIVNVQHRSELAGIADETLHSVMTFLNSLELSLNVDLNFRGEGLANLKKANNSFRDDPEGFRDFFFTPSRCRDFITYLLLIEESMIQEQEEARAGFAEVREKLLFIEKITGAQQKYGGRGKWEDLDPEEVLNDALTLQAQYLLSGGVRIKKEIHAHCTLMLSRVLLLHILVNLIRNAVEAMQKKKQEARVLTLVILSREEDILIKVRDTGCGIPRENLEKIFEPDFSARKRGFGLHSCRLYAGKMGGEIRASSKGPGQGAEFTIKLKTGGISGDLV